MSETIEMLEIDQRSIPNIPQNNTDKWQVMQFVENPSFDETGLPIVQKLTPGLIVINNNTMFVSGYWDDNVVSWKWINMDEKQI